MQFDFDRIIDRRKTDSMKWRFYAGRDVIPMWVADMDFASPPSVLEALQNRVNHSVFGYADPDLAAIEAIVDMLKFHYNWSIEPEWLIWTPGLVVALNLCCRMLKSEQDSVLTSIPIYPPFLTAPKYTKRQLQTVPLIKKNGRYELDYNALEGAITNRSRLFMLCNPHNPTGRVYTREELEAIADICLRHKLIVCSDEVHCGLILDEDKPHIPFASLTSEIAAQTITLMAPSKTYNLAGLMCAFAIIPNPVLRQRFRKVARGIVTELNTFGYTACHAAYREGESWRLALLEYLRQNRKLVEENINTLPGIRMTHVEATYLAWLDCREAVGNDPFTLFEKAGVGLSNGSFFGAPGFLRMNFGCPRATLQKALKRMRKALYPLNKKI